MKCVLCCLLALTLHVANARSQVTPVQKIIEMLNGMLAQGKKDKHDEEIQFATYKQFCGDTSASKNHAIKEANQAIESLNADIQNYAVTVDELNKEIAERDTDMAVWAGDVKAATNVRKLEKADFTAMQQDYSESIDALERAIAVLKKQAYDRAQGTSLMQVSALRNLRLIPEAAKRAIDAFLAEEPEADPLSVRAPEANAYEFQSQGIVDTLEKLHDKFAGELAAAVKEETKSHHAYEVLMQDLKGQTDQATQENERRSAAKAQTLQNSASAQGELADTTATRDADKTYLADLTAVCNQKAVDFEARQQLRADEITALEQAIEIISSNTVTGAAEKHLGGLLQSSGSALAQLRGDDNVALARVAEYLRSRSQQLNSPALLTIATHASGDPFAKVKKMIQDLIWRLMEEGTQEMEHKGWCDAELVANEVTRTAKTKAVEQLHAEIDQLQASNAKLTQEVADLTQSVADLEAAMAKATELRQEETATNAVTVKEAQEAQTAVAQALAILKEFYAKAGDATALAQQQPVAPEIFDKPYKGLQSASGGVVGMLEVIQSDFARLEANTAASEAAALAEYKSFMNDSAVDKVRQEKDIEHKTARKQRQTQQLVVKQNDLEGTQQELDAALAYYDKLKPSCVDPGVSYEERVARREEEIQSLKEALNILNGKDIA